jgi:hypothetical protein
MSATFEPDLGGWRLRSRPLAGFGVVIEGVVHDGGVATPEDYVNDVLLAGAHRDAFFGLVDQVGLVVCTNVDGDLSAYEDVRGRSSPGRLSQGEYYHHDGCSGPTKPRVVEIRCPRQAIARHTRTAIAPFPATVHAMLLELPAALRASRDLASPCAAAAGGEPLAADAADSLQGLVIRTIRRALSPDDARAYLSAVDVRVGAYREPWAMGETRFIANANGGQTMQHRRAYLERPGARPNGSLVKRWPADDPVPAAAVCARVG